MIPDIPPEIPPGPDVAGRANLGRRLILLGVLINILLAGAKLLGGILGRSNALIADGLESTLDIFSSTMMWGALKVAGRPPDSEHPYGHGKVESLAAVAGALILIAAGLTLATQSMTKIFQSFAHPGGELPAPFTLIIVILTIVLKESLYRLYTKKGREVDSAALMADAWHHRSDAITSIAALAGISMALMGGHRWAVADPMAALLSCAIILFNGGRMLRGSLSEILDQQMPPDVIHHVMEIVQNVPGVTSVEKCRVRKSGLTRIADLHVRVNGEKSVTQGHAIAHQAKDQLLSSGLNISDVTVHIEPEYQLTE